MKILSLPGRSKKVYFRDYRDEKYAIVYNDWELIYKDVKKVSHNAKVLDKLGTPYKIIDSDGYYYSFELVKREKVDGVKIRSAIMNEQIKVIALAKIIGEKRVEFEDINDEGTEHIFTYKGKYYIVLTESEIEKYIIHSIIANLLFKSYSKNDLDAETFEHKKFDLLAQQTVKNTEENGFLGRIVLYPENKETIFYTWQIIFNPE